MAVACAILLIRAQANAQTATVPISTNATYLTTSQDPEAVVVTPIDLVSLGIKPGDVIRLESVGTVFVCEDSTCPWTDPPILGAFTAGPQPTSFTTIPTQAPPAVSPPACATNTPTDIDGDFAFSQPPIEVEVPQGATSLWVALQDCWYSDNSGSLSVLITSKHVLESLELNPEVIVGSASSAGDVTATLTLSAPAPSSGADVKVGLNIRWFAMLVSFPDVVSADSLVTIPAGQLSDDFFIEADPVLFPVVADVSASYGGERKVARLTVMPEKIPEFGGQANHRVEAILDFFFNSQSDVTSLGAYEKVFDDVILARNDLHNPEAGQDIYLAAADHFLQAATLIAVAPLPLRSVFFALLSKGLPLYEGWKAAYQRLPSSAQQWINQNLPILNPDTTDRKASRATWLSVYWTELVLIVGLGLS